MAYKVKSKISTINDNSPQADVKTELLMLLIDRHTQARQIIARLSGVYAR